MPRRQRASFRQAAVSAIRRKPVQPCNHLRREGDAVLHFAVTVCVVCAPTRGNIKQAAGNRGIMNFVRVFITEFMQAASSTAITEGFPL
jgi:sulfur relay (sulfurtransferase) complex TusBCD TusD component (DsrE family)